MAPAEDGRSARTEWSVRRRLQEVTLLELVPRTGRQHQLRAHLAAIGHPILGDKLYLGGDGLFVSSLVRALTPAEIASLGMERQALHAWQLELEHPLEGRPLRLEAPLWPDMERRIAAAEPACCVR
jgi:23S rRNA-/tRNA-specific pseudouridylate synthase